MFSLNSVTTRMHCSRMRFSVAVPKGGCLPLGPGGICLRVQVVSAWMRGLRYWGLCGVCLQPPRHIPPMDTHTPDTPLRTNHSGHTPLDTPLWAHSSGLTFPSGHTLWTSIPCTIPLKTHMPPFTTPLYHTPGNWKFCCIMSFCDIAAIFSIFHNGRHTFFIGSVSRHHTISSLI